MLNTLPDNEADLFTLIKATQRQGPPALLQLMLLCYWLNGQRCDYLVHRSSGSSLGYRREYLGQFRKILDRILHLSSEQPPDVDPPDWYPRPAPKDDEPYEMGPIPDEKLPGTIGWLIEYNDRDLAHSMLLRLDKHFALCMPRLISSPSAGPFYEWARLWAYWGNAAKARQIQSRITERITWQDMDLETVIALGQFYQMQDAAVLVAEIAALRSMGDPKKRLTNQERLLHELLIANAAEFLPAALDHIRETCLDSDWDFKYRIRVSNTLDLLWTYRNPHRVTIYHFLSALLVDEAKAGMSVRAEPGHGIATMEDARWLVWSWVERAEVERMLAQVQAWEATL